MAEFKEAPAGASTGAKLTVWAHEFQDTGIMTCIVEAELLGCAGLVANELQ